MFRTPGGLVVVSLAWHLLLHNIRRGQHSLIVGPMGVGKTSLAIEAALHLGRPLEVFHFGAAALDAEATVIGTTQLRNGETRFVRSRFVQALTTERCVVVGDEFNRAPREVLNPCLSVLDGQARLPVDIDEGPGRIAECAPGVVLVATANIGPEYCATDVLDPAILDRVQNIRIGFPEPWQEQELLEERGVESQVAAWIVRIANEIRKAYVHGELTATVSVRKLLGAGDLVRDEFPVEAVFESIVSAFDPPSLAKVRTIVRATK